MKKQLFACLSILLALQASAQTNPIITAWLRNTTNILGRHYVSGNSTAIQDATPANVQTVQYSNTSVYISTSGIPAYVTGPFLDGNPSLASNQNAIFKFPLTPAQNTGNPIATTGGNIGVFINGVALFDYRDGVSWNNAQQKLCGGPIQPPCMGDGLWNRDAVVAERVGFDCAKGHPAMGNYHHHQNPSAFKLDLNVISTVCNLYDADGLYVIDSSKHSPLIGYAYDGFPIYGAYAYKNLDATGGITRMKSSYRLKTSMTNRTNGPAINSTYPLGLFKEDYEYIAPSAGQTDYLDEHNGRICKTPEYPNGSYCYFATVDANWNSAYPYVVGPTFYGTKVATKVTSITESTTTYNPTTNITSTLSNADVSVFPNPSSDLLVVQMNDLTKTAVELNLYDLQGKLMDRKIIYPGTTIAYFDTKTFYAGIYVLQIVQADKTLTQQISIQK